MRLANICENDSALNELMSPGAPTTTASPTPGSPMPGVGTIATGGNTQQPQSGLATGQMDPAQAAQAAKDRQEQKKQVQDQIKATEQQLVDLRKRLAELG